MSTTVPTVTLSLTASISVDKGGQKVSVTVPWSTTFFPIPNQALSTEPNLNRIVDALNGPIEDMVNALAINAEREIAAADRREAEAAAVAATAATAAASPSA